MLVFLPNRICREGRSPMNLKKLTCPQTMTSKNCKDTCSFQMLQQQFIYHGCNQKYYEYLLCNLTTTNANLIGTIEIAQSHLHIQSCLPLLGHFHFIVFIFEVILVFKVVLKNNLFSLYCTKIWGRTLSEVNMCYQM